MAVTVIVKEKSKFLDKYIKEFHKKSLNFSTEAMKVLVNYQWPGNIRELENLIQKFIWMHDSTIIDVPDLPEHMRFSISSNRNKLKTLAEVEKEHILHILDLHQGNKSHAAKFLGIDRKTLIEKLKKYKAGS